MAFSVITHKPVFLCPHSIFRMFSADRKRVETALENCNLPSGRVRHQNTETPSFFQCCCLLVFPLSLNLLPFVSLLLYLCLSLLSSLQALSSSPSIHQRILSTFSSFSILLKQQLIAALLICLESYFLDVCMTSHSELI